LMLLGVDVGGTFTDAVLSVDGRLVATDGFTDLVELGRQSRRELYRLCSAHPSPLAPPELRFGAAERMGPRSTRRALRAQDAATLAERVAQAAPEAVAVCLLHAWRDPAHELAIGAALRERLGPDVHVSLSHDVVGTLREFERAATTEIDAALSPLLARYLARLRERTRAAGLPDAQVMQSSGGLIDAGTAARHAALTVLSGPAGGAAAAVLVARAAGEPNLLCFDMGGTSCDVCVVEGGEVRETASREVAGRPLALPMVDIHTVGAGGGSIAWRDAGGALRVGPRSAGALPGPAAYGRGGTAPTVTDAHVVLGTLGEDTPLAGGVRLAAGPAWEAVGRLAGELGLAPPACAEGILRVANAEMVRALRVMTVERGLDPRDFALLAFGGAGPLHAAAIADELGMRRILVPRASGVLSALGLAAADRRVQRQRSVLLSGAGLSDAALDATRRELLAEGRAILDAPRASARVAYEMRYRGQSHELSVRGDGQESAGELREAFAAEHELRYGWREDSAAVEVVTIRVAAVETGPVLGPAPAAQLGAERPGPAVLRLAETTIVVPAGWRATPDANGGHVLERER
ncbi:MAG: hydantoinase/oxoprolinase family protein, partial [Solirubrobacteraceae bacterium]|nr:hydantoinase/oxoprolinase family protein [Solirubrobacteraceae bacterium]